MYISTLQSNLDFIKSLYFHEGWKDEECRDTILEAVEECNEKILDAFGWSMHFLYRHRPSVEAVEKVANKFPSTLSYEDDDGQIPIQSAAGFDGFEYVPVLAKEGMKHKVGGEDARGGLLLVYDAKRLNVLKELRALGLLLKNDIREHCLLGCSCSELSKESFEYLVNWDPDALIETITVNKPLIHDMENYNVQNSLHLILKAGFKYHPEIGGLLFIEDDNGTIAFDKICNDEGEKTIMNILHEILSPTQDFPILHHIFIKAPKHKELFTTKFPWAYHLKDHNGRTLQQSILAAGPDVMNVHYELFASLSDNQIQTKDPVTTLFPFAAMVVGEHADLEKCYYLLRRQPSVLERRSRTENIRRRRKKRKVSNNDTLPIL